MKKLLVVVLLLALCAGCAFADGEAQRRIKQGNLAILNMSEAEYQDFVVDGRNNNVWALYLINMPEYSMYVNPDADVYTFSSLSELLMALDSGKIDRVEFPQPSGEYLLRHNADKYITYLVANGVNYYLSMGFKDGSKWFEPFNSAIKAINEDDTLLLLKAKYVDYANDDPKTITFEKFPNAETVKIAVTGDMPPIDYVAADGSAAGFNTALLAEIAKRLKVNIELVSINAGARAAALASGRADGVFWFWYDKTTKTPRDVPAGVSLTEPYYSYDTLMYIGKKISK